MDVLTTIPTAVVMAGMRMLPRLQAEESITEANRIAFGNGKLKEETATQMARQWATAANPDAGPAKPQPMALAARGFAVRRVKKIRKPEEKK
jgi:hypothetical protein